MSSPVQLSASEKKKKNLSLKKELAHIEKQIYDLETTYLEDTQEFGNIFVGWKQYFSNERGQKRKRGVTNDQRLFSLSSASSPAALKEKRQSVISSSSSSNVSSSAPKTPSVNKKIKK